MKDLSLGIVDGISAPGLTVDLRAEMDVIEKTYLQTHASNVDAKSTVEADLLHLLVPYLPMLVTGLFIVVGTATGVRLNPVEIYVGLGVVLLVIARQLLTLIDNVKLLEQLRDSRERLRHQAYHDPLTGIANRAPVAASWGLDAAAAQSR